MAVILGIDPGASPTLCFLQTRGNVVTFVDGNSVSGDVQVGARKRKQPIPALVKAAIEYHGPDAAWIEDVWVMPKQGIASAAVFIGAARIVEGVLHGMGVPVERVRPQTWQKVMACPRGKDGARARVCSLYPREAWQFTTKISHNKADALLIASYGARQRAAVQAGEMLC